MAACVCVCVMDTLKHQASSIARAIFLLLSDNKAGRTKLIGGVQDKLGCGVLAERQGLGHRTRPDIGNKTSLSMWVADPRSAAR